MTVELLMTQPLARSCVATLRQQFTLHDYVSAADPAAPLAEVGPRIRGCAGGKVSAELMGRLPALERRAFSDFALVLDLVPGMSRWSREERRGVVEVVRAKTGRTERRYLALLQRHRRLREALIRLGS